MSVDLQAARAAYEKACREGAGHLTALDAAVMAAYAKPNTNTVDTTTKASDAHAFDESAEGEP